MDGSQTTALPPDRPFSTPLLRAARLLQAALPHGWHVEIDDTEPTVPTLRVLQTA